MDEDGPQPAGIRLGHLDAVLNPVRPDRADVRPRARRARLQRSALLALHLHGSQHALHELGRERAAHPLLHPFAPRARVVRDAHVRAGRGQRGHVRALVGRIARREAPGNCLILSVDTRRSQHYDCEDWNTDTQEGFHRTALPERPRAPDTGWAEP